MYTCVCILGQISLSLSLTVTISCLGPVSFRSATSSPDANENLTKIRNEWHNNEPKKGGQPVGGGWGEDWYCERELAERKGNTHTCISLGWQHARQSPIAIGYGFYFYRLSKIPSTRVWRAPARVSCLPCVYNVDKRKCSCVFCIREHAIRRLCGALPALPFSHYTVIFFQSTGPSILSQPNDLPRSIRFSGLNMKKINKRNGGLLAEAGTEPFRVFCLCLLLVVSFFLTSAMCIPQNGIHASRDTARAPTHTHTSSIK